VGEKGAAITERKKEGAGEQFRGEERSRQRRGLREKGKGVGSAWRARFLLRPEVSEEERYMTRGNKNRLIVSKDASSLGVGKKKKGRHARQEERGKGPPDWLIKKKFAAKEKRYHRPLAPLIFFFVPQTKKREETSRPAGGEKRNWLRRSLEAGR